MNKSTTSHLQLFAEHWANHQDLNSTALHQLRYLTRYHKFLAMYRSMIGMRLIDRQKLNDHDYGLT